jgi:hypothetical protein
VGAAGGADAVTDGEDEIEVVVFEGAPDLAVAFRANL